jgi:hypothetical protein
MVGFAEHLVSSFSPKEALVDDSQIMQNATRGHNEHIQLWQQERYPRPNPQIRANPDPPHGKNRRGSDHRGENEHAGPCQWQGIEAILAVAGNEHPDTDDAQHKTNAQHTSKVCSSWLKRSHLLTSDYADLDIHPFWMNI